MHHYHSADNIAELSPTEQLLAFLYRNNLPRTLEAINTHWERIKAELNITQLPHDVAKYLSDDTWKYYESSIVANVLKYKRIDLFLHPRFAPLSIHSHNYFEIKYLLSGSANMLIAGQSITMDAGDFVFITPQIEHMVSIYDTESLLINIIITPDAASAAFPRIFFSENPLSRFFTAALQGKSDYPYMLCPTGSDEAIHQTILDAYHKRNDKGPVPAHLLCESLVELLLLEILSSHCDSFCQSAVLSPFPEKLFPILGYINDHCATVSLTTLSKVFNYSPAHLSRLIRQHMGKTFSELLRTARLTQASILLRSSDIPIQEIILRTGYSGKSNFYRAFQETFGMTPAQFRHSAVPLDDIAF